MCFKGVAGLSSWDWILVKVARSLSQMLFQRAVEEALDMDMMPFAVPLRIKSAWVGV